MAGETGPAITPIEQFSITPLIPIRIAGHDFSLTNSSLYMLIAVAIACLVMTAGARGGPGIPGRLQSLAELAYEFIAGMLRSASGLGSWGVRLSITMPMIRLRRAFSSPNSSSVFP